MPFPKLMIRSVELRPVSVPLRRPVVSKVGLYEQWPLILIDLQTEEGLVGRSYLEPYLRADRIVAEPFELTDGHLIVPNRPGNGLVWNEDAVKRHRYDM